MYDSFLEAIEKGELSVSQKRGIITLLHKGNDRKQLNNWRPITLLNTDYKIFSKIIATRLKPLMSSIIHHSQKGFIKGRNISEVIRYIDDTINLANQSHQSGLIASVDFSKAFDSVNKNTITNVLQMFNFGPKFRNLVKILIKNSESSVKNGGWVSSWFSTNRGVRQGCCASPYLFLLVAEIMAIKLRGTCEIEGLNINYKNKLVEINKVIQYADDTTLILKNENELNSALTIIEEFGKISGLKLNKSKSNILAIGGF